MDNDSKFFV